MPMDAATHIALGPDRPTPAQVNGRSNADILPSLDHTGDAAYHHCPEAFPGRSVPAGTVTTYKDWDGSRVFANTLRDIYAYTPANLDTTRPAQLIVFNDGFVYASPRREIRAPRVLDSLHAHGEIDAQTLYGNWPLANKTMDDALTYAGYEHRFEFGEGGHSLRHGGALFADSLRWLLPRTKVAA